MKNYKHNSTNKSVNDAYIETYIEINNKKIHTYIKTAANQKSNKILLIFHGVYSCAALYKNLANKFKDDYHKIYLIDIPGFGVSEPLESQDLENTSECINLLIHKIKQTQEKNSTSYKTRAIIDIIGHSYGAFLLQYTLKHNLITALTINKLVLVSVGSLYNTLHFTKFDIWRTYFWGVIFRYRLYARCVRILLSILPVYIKNFICKYINECKILNKSEPGEKLLSNSLTVNWKKGTFIWNKPCGSNIIELNKKLQVYLLWGEKDQMFTYKIANNFAKKNNIYIDVIPNEGHQPILSNINTSVVYLKKILNK